MRWRSSRSRCHQQQRGSRRRLRLFRGVCQIVCFANKLRDHENEIRGLLRPFGLKVGRIAARDFEARVRELMEGHPKLDLRVSALLSGRAEMQSKRRLGMGFLPLKARSRSIQLAQFAHPDGAHSTTGSNLHACSH